MSPPGIPTPEQALENLKDLRRSLRGRQSVWRNAQTDAARLERECEQIERNVKRAESTLMLATQEAVANEAPRT